MAPRPSRATSLRLLTLAAGALACTAAPGLGASRTSTIPDWFEMTAVMSGRTVAYSDAATVRIDPADSTTPLPPGLQPFDYYRVETGLLGLDRTRTRFVGDPQLPVTVRTSIGYMGAGDLDIAPSGRVVLTPGPRTFSGPVIFCCDAEDREVVLFSDGRADAPRPLAVGIEPSGRTRWLARDASGATRLHVADPLDPASQVDVPFAGRPDPARVALAGTLAAWVEEGTPGTTLRIGRVGGAPRDVPVGGEIAEVRADVGAALVTARLGGGWQVARVTPAGAVRRVWTGAARPRAAALGGGTVAVAAGRRVLAGRAAPLRLVRRAQGTVATVAVDGDRVAVFERRIVKRQRVTVVRLWSAR